MFSETESPLLQINPFRPFKFCLKISICSSYVIFPRVDERIKFVKIFYISFIRSFILKGILIFLSTVLNCFDILVVLLPVCASIFLYCHVKMGFNPLADTVLH